MSVHNESVFFQLVLNHFTKMNLISGKARLFIIIATFNLKVILGTAMNQEILENFNLTTVKIIEKYGYPAETHTTESEDGYNLTVHRIPHGKNSTKPGFPIVVAHGMFADSSQFVHSGNDSLGFFLADKGYDVWLINFRGNHYTRTHKYLSTADSKFWDFSLHEHGIYDLPAYINYICNYTKNHELFFLGYSMGTTAFFILGSERPEYQKHIKGAVLLAPVVTMKYSKFPLRVLAAFGSILKVISDVHSHGEFYIDPEAYQKFVELSCPLSSPISKFCEHAFFALTAGSLGRVDKEPLSSHLNRFSSSTSTKVLVHYAQLIQSGKFRQYDYGILYNLITYNSKFPPEYNVHAITTPISLFVAPNDILATPKGVKETLGVLPSVETIYVVPDVYFGHGNFISGKENKKVLYPEVTRQIENLRRVSNAQKELSLINTFKKVHDVENYLNEDSFNTTHKNTQGSEREDSLEKSFINTHKPIHGSEHYPTEDSSISTPIHVHGSEMDPLEHSFNTHKKVQGTENYPTEDSFINIPIQVHGSERGPLEHSFNTHIKFHGGENYPIEDSLISTPIHVHGSEMDPLEHFFNTHKKFPGSENYPTEDSLISTPTKVYGSERDPLEYSFINTHKKAHGGENDPIEEFLNNNYRKAHRRKNDHGRHSLNDNVRKVHGRKKYPEENYATMPHYLY